MATHEQTGIGRWVEARLARLAPSPDWDPSLPANRARLDKRLTAPRGRSRLWMMAAATAVVALALAEMPAVRAAAQRCGEWLLAASGAGAGPVRPTMLASDMVDVEGRPVALESFRGKAVLLTFWTPTCRQCQTERLWFQDFQQTYRDRGFVVLAVRPQSSIDSSIPTTLILDRDGRIAVRHVGFCSKDEYRRDIEKVLNEL